MSAESLVIALQQQTLFNCKEFGRLHTCSTCIMAGTKGKVATSYRKQWAAAAADKMAEHSSNHLRRGLFIAWAQYCPILPPLIDTSSGESDVDPTPEDLASESSASSGSELSQDEIMMLLSRFGY